MKQLLTILLIFISFGAFAQTYDNLPSGFVPYGTQYYKNPAGKIIVGTSAGKFRIVSQQKELDSLFALTTKNPNAYVAGRIPFTTGANTLSSSNLLKWDNSNQLMDVDGLIIASAIQSKTAPSLTNDVIRLGDMGGYIRNNNTGTPQTASANITGTFKLDNGSGTTNMAAGIVAINNGINSTLINGGEITLTTASASDSSSKAATTAFVKRIKGAASGVASLDINGKVPLSQMSEAILGSINYKGSYNISTNSPSLPTAAPSNKGWLYIVVDSGIHTPSGKEYYKGDWYTSNGIQWEVLNQTNKVGSVNGMTGAVTGLMDLNSLQTVTARKTFTEYPVFENGAVFLNGAGPSLYNTDNTFATSFAYEPGATTNTIYRFRSFPINTSNQIAITRDFEAGATIGANTTGNAATSSDAAKWNGHTIASSAPTTGQFIKFNGSNFVSSNIIAASPISFNNSTSEISLNTTAAKTALGINDGSALNNSASKWNGESFNAGLNSNPGTLLAYDNTNNQWRPTNQSQINVASATKWYTEEYAGATNTNPTGEVMAFNATTLKWNPTPISNLKPLMPISLQDVTSVGFKTNNLIQVTDAGGSSLSKGLTFYYSPANSAGYIGTYDYPNSLPLNTIINPNGGNVGIGVTPAVKLDVDGDIKANNLISGTYTPTVTLGTSLTSSTAHTCHYTRVGNEVTVHGWVEVTAASLSGNTNYSITLPIASNMTSADDLSGVGQYISSGQGTTRVVGDASADKAIITVAVQAGVPLPSYFSFTYTIK